MVEINLLPQQYRKSNEPNGWRLATYALIPVTIAAILIPEVVTATRVGDLQKQRDSLQGEVAALTQAKQEFDTLTATETQLKQVTDIATQLRDRKTYWSNDLATFTAQLPAGSNVRPDQYERAVCGSLSPDRATAERNLYRQECTARNRAVRYGHQSAGGGEFPQRF